MGAFNEDYNKETVVLGGGCFWFIEDLFKKIKGVVSSLPGYAGGDMENPFYEDVALGNTKHAEVVKVIYDTKIISLETILEIFFEAHDPTTKDKQGNDVGNQYRSIILYTSEEQKQKIKHFIEDLENKNHFSKKIVTEVKPLKRFYDAESQHRDYYENHPEKVYCQMIISPKLSKMKEKFSKQFKTGTF